MEKFCGFFDKHKCVFLTTVFVLFIIFTLIGVSHHELWFDEAHAWLIAKNLNFFEVLKQMRYEGHMFVWFSLLMPFAKLNIAYPISMQIINLLCICGAVYVLLKKAPFHPLLKILIIFSAPIFYQYAIMARCYSSSVFFLFLLAALFKNKLKHPCIYAILIMLCANTSLMALFGAVAFATLFLFDYIKSKPEFYKSKEFYIITSIALFTVGILGFQLLGGDNSNQAEMLKDLGIVKNTNLFKVLIFTVGNGFWAFVKSWQIIFVLIYFAVSILLFKNNKKVLFFWLCTLIGLEAIFMFIYNGYVYHHYFFYIYFILSLWLYASDNDFIKNKNYYLAILILTVTTMNLMYFGYKNYKYDLNIVTSYAKQFAQKIADTPEITNGNIVICDERTYNIVPYLDNLNIKAYNCTDGKQASFYDRSSDMGLRVKSKVLTPEYFKKFEDKDIYLLTTNNPKAEFFSDYYMLNAEFCSSPAPSDDIQLCVIKLTPGYEDEQ